MSKAKRERPATLRMSSDVAREIRQHARSNNKTEVCGVLIGSESDGVTTIEACIAGVNAAQGGAHVTFTQDTWEHIYKIKDRDYPDERIVGWYHSHPGFGVFLSDHDTFIHQNFFSSPQQVAWVYDPHSDEEGCFGWRGGRIERLAQFGFIDGRGGEVAGGADSPASRGGRIAEQSESEGEESRQTKDEEDVDLTRLTQIVVNVFSYLAVFILGGVLTWYFLPRFVGIPIPVDPQTGQPLQLLPDNPKSNSQTPGAPSTEKNPNRSPDGADRSKSGVTQRDDVHK
jgi:proteasome lid subunit RPN8/RPN11